MPRKRLSKQERAENWLARKFRNNLKKHTPKTVTDAWVNGYETAKREAATKITY